VTFLAPALLLAAAALAVPVLLHLFRKRDTSVRTFPALRYLKRTTRDRARIVRLRQLILLALRMAALALLVLAGARLVLPLGGTDHPPAAVALILDNGIGSSMIVEERRILDHLADQALATLDRMGTADRVWFVEAGAPWRPSPPLTPDEARRRVQELEPTDARSNLPAAVARARSLMESAAFPVREILVLSKLEGGSFPPDTDAEPAGEFRTVVGTVHDDLPPNRALALVSVGGGLPPRAGLPTEIAVEVVGRPRANQAVRVQVEDELLTAGRTDGEGRALLDLPPMSSGWLVGRVELDPDALRSDDVRHFALPVRPPPLVRAPAGLPVHLATALEVLVERERIAMEDPAVGQDGEAAVGVEADGQLANGLRATLIFAPDDPVQLPALNRRLGEMEVGWRLEAMTGADPPRTLDASDPGLRLPSGLEIRRSHRLTPTPEGRNGRVLARLSDDSPWIVHVPAETDPNQGSSGVELPAVLLVASAPKPESSELPTSAAMIPFLSATLELLDGGDPAIEIEAGRPMPLPPGAAHVSTPAGTRLGVTGTSSFLETGRAGVYDVEDAEESLLARVTVNASAPSGGPRLTSQDAAARFGPRAVGTGSAREWTRATLGERSGREVWRPLLLALLLLLLAEGWLAARNDPDRPTDQTLAEPNT
jgi:hypothetical protein